MITDLVLQGTMRRRGHGQRQALHAHLVQRCESLRVLLCQGFRALRSKYRTVVRLGSHECVFITVVPIISCSHGGRGIVEDMCYERLRAEDCVD